MTADAFKQALEESKAILLETRNRRLPPLRDEKILTAWNGLMISAFARAGLMLDNPEYTKKAVDAGRFVQSHLFIGKRLCRSYKDGHAGHNAFLEDYAFVIAGFIDLFEATHELQWLNSAIELEQILTDHYEDLDGGGFFATSNDHEKMIAREKPNYDGAVPSGNAVAVMNLLRLASLTSNHGYRERAQKALTCFSRILESHPTALAELLLAIDYFLDQPKEVVIVTPAGQKEDAEPFLDQFRKTFLPNRTLVVASEGSDQQEKTGTISMLKNRPAVNGTATAYVCEGNTCKTPTTDPDEFSRQLG
jgi:hypothetical protein